MGGVNWADLSRFMTRIPLPREPAGGIVLNCSSASGLSLDALWVRDERDVRRRWHDCGDGLLQHR
jgi:hypothetical protein